MHFALYRSERPETFEEMIGQKHIVKILQNQLRTGTVNQAYLFTGIRGTGKTTTARILAKALNCTGDGEQLPCGKCENCKAIRDGKYMDVIEIDAASNNKVDDIRSLIDSVYYPPVLGKYKIYIIDEVHMLTDSAENAFLKTLEEPPEYVTILLLASNPQKFLPTILSRVVQWKIKPVAQEKIVSLLVSKYEVEESKAEFCAGFSMGNIGKAIRLATVPDYQEIYDFCIHLLKYIHEMPVHEIIYAMKDLSKHKLKINEYLDFIMVWYRDVLMLKATNNPNKILFKKEYKDISKQSQRSSFEGLEHIITAIDKAKQRLDANVNFDIAMELLMLTIKEN